MYKSRHPATEAEQADPAPPPAVAAFALSELRAALRRMKPGKAKDSSGIAAEMLKIDCPVLQAIVLGLFNEVLTSRAVPSEWRTSKLIVSLKKGDPKLPGNYRPVAILSLL